MSSVTPTGRERRFDEHELIVSRTDTKGRITYGNDVFVRMSGFSLPEMIGKPHNLIRHPDMPRGVFKLLWDTIQSGDEIFAYVLNLAKNGDHYWVLAHVTPTYDLSRRIVGYHSSRRVPERAAIAAVTPLYELMLQEERRHQGAVAQAEASLRLVGGILADKGVTYDEFVWSVIAPGGVAPGTARPDGRAVA